MEVLIAIKNKICVAHKIEIYPDDKIKDIIDDNLNYARYLYNLGLEWMNKLRSEAKKKFTIRSLDFCYFLQSSERRWKDFETSNQNLIGSLRTSVGKQLYRSFHNFFINPKHFRYPKFKSKKVSSQSFKLSVNKTTYGYDVRWNFNNGRPYLLFPKTHITSRLGGTKIFGFCYMAEVPRYNEKPISVTIKNEKGRYFAIFHFKIQNPYKQTVSSQSVGIDLGIKTLMTCYDSSGKYFVENQDMKKLIKIFQKIKKTQSKMDRSFAINKVKTGNYYRLHERLKMLWRRFTNIRLDFLHKITTSLVKEYSMICVEDLDVAKMLKKGKGSISKYIGLCCFGMILRMFEYKCLYRGVRYIKVDRYYPSSQICSACGDKYKIKLTERIYCCPHCGIEIDRDLNAAKNILTEAQRIADKNQQDV